MIVEHLGLLLGVLLMIGGVLLLRSVLRFRRSAVAARGRVVRLTSPGTGLRRRIPEFEFVTENGDEVTVVSTSAYGRFFAGDEVPVLYDPTNPRRARIDTLSHLYGFPTVLMLAGAAAVGIWVARADVRALERTIRVDRAVSVPAGLGAGVDGGFPSPVVSTGPRAYSELALGEFERVRSLHFEENGGLRAAAFDAGGRWAVMATGAEGARLVDLDDGEVGGRLTASNDRVRAVDISPDGHVAALGGTGRVWLHQLPDGELLAEVDLADPTGRRTQVSDLAVAPSGDVLVAAAGRDLFFIDVRSGTNLGPVRAGGLPVNRVAWSPDGRFLASGSGTEIMVWPTSRLEGLGPESARCRVELDEVALGLAASNDGVLAATAPGSGGSGELVMVRWDPCGIEARHPGGAVGATMIVLAPGGDQALIPDVGELSAMDVADGAVIGTLGAGLTATGVDLSAAGDRLLTLSFEDARITVWDRR